MKILADLKLCKNCKSKERPEGRGYRYCSECAVDIKLEKHRLADRKYAKNNQAKLKEYRYYYDRSELGQAKYARYRNTDKYREYARSRYHSMDENRKRARTVVRNAIRDGKFLQIKWCEKCGVENWGVWRSMIEAHHYLGYEPGHWFDIQWLCVPCHKKAHAGKDGDAHI